MPQLLGQILQETSHVPAEQIDRALVEQEQGEHAKLLGEILVDARACTPEQVAEALARSYDIPFARISPRLVDPAVVAILPRAFLDKHAVLPLFVVEGMLTLAMAEPANLFLLDEVRRLSGYNVQVVAATARDIEATLQAYLPNEKVFVVDEIVDELSGPADAAGGANASGEPAVRFAAVETGEIDPAELARAAADAPVVKLVNYLIHAAVKESAAQVHLEPGPQTMRIRFRIDGRLHERLHPPMQLHAAVAARLKTLAGLDPGQRRLPQQGSIRLSVDGRSILVRLSTLPGGAGEKIVLHVVDSDRAFLRLERLGFSYDTLKAWRKLLTRQSGVLLVAAPVGSGKTTTLHACLAELGREDANICALEDRLEHPVPGVNHFSPDVRAGLDGPAALAAILRQEPDVLMVGDVNDGETARLCAGAALSGRLVLAGLRAPDAPAAIARLKNLGIEPYAMAETIAGVLCQRLVRKLCPACREAYTPTPTERKMIEKHAPSTGGAPQAGSAGASGGGETLFRAKGCEHCHHLGFVGRIGLFELLVVDAALAERIGGGASAEELRESAGRTGYKTIRSDGMEKVRSGITTLEEILRVAP
jgi:type IV pilus assembly protein PilB